MAIKNNFPSLTLFLPLQLCCYLSCALTPLLIAQAAGAEVSGVAEAIDEVVVTASKRNQNLKDFSGSVSIIKGDSFNPGANISDLANMVPGLSVINNGPRGIASINIRGLRMDEVGSNDFGGDGATVTTYIDNIPLQGFFVPPASSLKDLQQIEVLRGPQGTLYGNASVGGLIRYVTAKPDLAKTTVTINSSLSQTNESGGLNYDTDLIVNAPLIDNVLGVRLLLSKESNAGFIDGESIYTFDQDKANSDYTTEFVGRKNDINSDQTKQFRGSVLWQPTDEFSLSGSYTHQKINAEDRQASNKDVTGDEFTATNYFLQPMEGKLNLSSIDATYDVGWATLTASGNRYDYTTKTVADLTDFLLYNYGAGYYAEYEDFTAFTRGDVDVVKNSGELRLASPNDQPLRWLLGAFFSSDDLDVIIVDRVPGFKNVFGEDRPDALDFIATQQETLREQSLYSEVSYDIRPEWEVVIGTRYFSYKDQLETCSLLFPVAEYEGDNYPLACTDNDDDDSGFSGKFSSKYKFNEFQNVYLTVSEGFRRGGANLLPVEVTHHRSYEPDKAVNYELGTHSEFLNGKLQFNSAIYVMDWKKIQVSSVIENRSVTVNAGAARSKGIELETIAELNQEWNLTLSYSMAEATLSETVPGISGGDEDANFGDRLPGSPKHEWNLSLDYQHIFGDIPFDARVNYSYFSDVNTALNKTFIDYAQLNSYSTINAQANVSLRNWQLGVFVNNMSNTIAVTSKRTATLYGEHGQFNYITRPRTIGLKASYQF